MNRHAASLRGRPAPDRWNPTHALHRAAVSAVLVIAAGVVLRRPDLLVLATPPAIVTVWSLVTRPGPAPELGDRIAHDTLREGDATFWRGDIVGAAGGDVVSAAVADTNWIERRPNRGAVTGAVAAGCARVEIGLRATRWGRWTLEPVRVTVGSTWGSFRWSTRSHHQAVVTLPLPAVFDSAAPVRPTDGLVGSYRSVRPGEGSEFAGIRDFQVGDRMRRINWPRSLRSDGLHVNATWADQDTHVALIVDAGDDLGVSGGVDGSASSLDTTVRAAGAIAEHYVRRGDRVSLRTFGEMTDTTVAPATGQSHLRRILHALSGVRAAGGRRSVLRADRERPTSGDALTVMLSPLVVPGALDRAVLLGRMGASVVVVDTLPDDVASDDDELTAIAWRIRLLERRRELRRVREFGIPVVRWLGPGSIDQFLRDVARRSAAPRVRQR